VVAYLESWSVELIWYVILCSFFFFIEIEVVFVHLVLWVDFSVGCTEESEAILVWQEQSY
jgi:hypothetical protein